MQITVDRSCSVKNSFRVQQVAGMFDVPLSEKSRRHFTAEVPGLDEAWDVGLIVGPSGSGKSSLAVAAYGPAVHQPGEWPADAAVIDGLAPLAVKEAAALLTAVGFSSPPAWVRPYGSLSTGERFRCDLARALAGGSSTGAATVDSSTTAAGDPRPLVVFDEFTSVVDRQVAQVGSAAVAKAVRSGLARRRFVAVTCHYDVAPWLEPDWIVDLGSGECRRGRLRRPWIALSVRRCSSALWARFAPHHYLSGALNGFARCYCAEHEERPVAFAAVLAIPGRRGHWRITRLVTLPDWQGLGIGLRLAEAIGDLYREQGLRLSITGAHPAVIAHCARSPLWSAGVLRKAGRGGAGHFARGYVDARRRATASFEYLGGG